MFFFQPAWLQHGGSDGQGRQPVFSVDMQVIGGRLATAGQDGRIRLWSCESLIKAGSLNTDEKSDKGGPKEVMVTTNTDDGSKTKTGSKIPKGALLATLAYHAGSVNCVRFSPDGAFLASGGDDNTVLTYEKLPGAGRMAGFGSSEEEVENWRCRKALRGHTGDVTDISWSSDSDRFCSSSVDNTVIVWSARAEKAMVKLEGHKALVKGVAWDPIGKFVASQSDDKSVIIWRTSDWNIEKKITAPFTDAVLHENNLAFFLRLCWSPCGSLLVATNAYAKKTGTHLAPMFSRESGLSDHVDFIGHQEPVVIGRFSSRLYSESPISPDAKSATKENPTYTCVALGSKDRGASLWRAGNPKPFVTCEEMFNSDVIDLAWGSDGYTLVACSTDGGIMLIRFEPKELGHVVPKAVEETVFRQLWENFGGTSSDNQLPESKIQVELETKNGAGAGSVDKDKASGVGEKEKRKLEPVMVKPDVVMVTPVKKEAAAKATLEGNLSGANEVSMEAAKNNSAPMVVTPPVKESMQREERVKGGRRRIIPQPIGAGSDGFNDSTSQSLGNIWQATVQQNTASGPPADIAVPSKRPRTSGLQGPGDLVGMIAAGDPTKDMKPWISTLRHQNHLPSAGRKGGARCRAMDLEPTPTLLETSLQSASRTSILTCSKGGGILWRDFIGAPVVALAGATGKFAAVATADAFLYIYSASSGRRLTPPISLEAPPHIMDTFEVNDKNLLLVVTRSAVVNLYSLDSMELLRSASATSLLVRVSEEEDEEEEQAADEKDERLRRGISVASVSDECEPILVLSDGHGFVHSGKFKTWLRIADDHAPNSEFYRLVPPPGDQSLLSKLQAGAAMTARKKGTALLPTAGLKRSAVETISHLENLLTASIALGSLDQYKHYLHCYALRLGSSEAVLEGGEKKLREVCEMLCEEGDVIGASKREMLREIVLPAISKSRRQQRLVEEFSVILDEFVNCKKDAGNGPATMVE